MTARILLTEYETSVPVTLTGNDRDALTTLAPSVVMRPAPGGHGQYLLTPDSLVGVVCLPNVVLEIQPKIPINRLLFLISFAIDQVSWRDAVTAHGSAPTVVEAMVPMFCRLVSRTINRGLLHGYRTEEEASRFVRGRILLERLAQRRAGMLLPIDVRYDEYTPDITENCLLLAALNRLMRLPLRSPRSIRSLREIHHAFSAVSNIQYSPSTIPDVPFTRLNSHYQSAIDMAKIILLGTSLRLEACTSPGFSFLINMNVVFEAFLYRALLEKLRLSEKVFPRGNAALRLDIKRRVTLRPDLTWWQYGRCIFVGDAKYKRLTQPDGVHGDLYQLLAYAIAADLPGGLLVYAHSTDQPITHDVINIGKTLVVESIDISGEPEAILAEVDRIAAIVRSLATHTSENSAPIAVAS